jgi:arylsulfatase A-like enzyme
MMKIFARTLIGLLALTLSAKSTARPNIVFVFSDDHATQAISAYGGILAKVAPTPHLDRLARDGMRFDRCMVGNSICGPSRATILTGKHSHKNGFMVNERQVFDGKQQTFPKLLQKAGYQTAIIGKWHLVSEPTGFDHWEVLPGQGSYYNPDFKSPAGRVRVPGYVSEVVTEKAKHWLDESRDADKPFMLMVQHKAPHRAWLPSQKYLNAFDDIVMPEPETLFEDYAGRVTAVVEQDQSIEKTMELVKDLKVRERDLSGQLTAKTTKRMSPEQLAAWDAAYQPKNDAFLEANLTGKELVRWKYQRYVKDYLRCIKSVDDSVGELRAHLKEKGLDKNTVFIYSSDQGFYLGEHGWFDKRFMYDESYRTPLLVSWPGVTKAGSVNADLVSNLDFAETFLEIAGLRVPADMQGASLVPVLAGQTPADWRDSLYYHYYEYPGWHMIQRHEGVYDGRYKLLHYYDLDQWELLDLKSDPQEMTNQYANPEFASVVTQMHQKLAALRTQYDLPKNVKQDLQKVDRRYHSSEQRKRALARRAAEQEKK